MNTRDYINPGRCLDTREAAEYTGLSPKTLETMRSRGGGPTFVKLGKRVVYLIADIDHWLTNNRRANTAFAMQGARS